MKIESHHFLFGVFVYGFVLPTTWRTSPAEIEPLYVAAVTVLSLGLWGYVRVVGLERRWLIVAGVVGVSTSVVLDNVYFLFFILVTLFATREYLSDVELQEGGG